jgi:hypothetical protein
VLPEDTVEFMVHPPFNEPDPGSVVPPVIMAVEPREEVEEAGGKTDAGPSKPPVLCYRIMPDMSATVVPCPEKPVPVQVLDLVSSVTSAIGQVPAMLWPPSSLQAGEEGPCDDGNACTVLDRTVRGTCTGDRVICIPAGRCNPASGCVYEPDEGSRTPLPVDAVTTATGMTRRTMDIPEAAVPAEGSACDDGNACTARDAIRDGTCQGRPVVCDDGDGMTSDACDPGSGCMHTRRERVPETTAPAAEREPEAIPEATPVVLEIVATIVPDACPEGCSCVTEAEARERFGRYLPCSDRPCGTTESREGTVQKYCLRPAM